MNTETSSELRASPPPQLQGRRRLPVVAEAPRLRRLQLNPDQWEVKISSSLGAYE